MTLLQSWLQTPAAKALSWTLFHSLWEGAIVALVLATALWAIRSPRARHAVACLALAAMLASFGLTLGRLILQPEIQDSPAEIRRIPPAASGFEAQWRAVKSETELRAADLLPWLAPLWIAGVLIFHLRSLASWMVARRLRHRGVCRAPDLWQQRLDQLRARLRLSRPVTLLESCLADAPVVIGYLRPVILMPVGLLAGLPAGQIESILLHELAHIRRYDYLVNLLQTFVEGLLFYHPAVWWISGLIRAERENCCDDLVVATTGDGHEYAVALAALEQNRCSTREAALAATGGNLVKRIRRLLYQPESSRAALTPVVAAGILTITAAVALVAWQAAPADNSLPQSSPYRLWLNEDVAYIATDQERADFNSLQTDKEREHFIEQFWLRRDPTPGTVENEFKEEHYRRIAYANERYFVRGKTPGWKTDRGRIYITYGPPNEIEDHSAGGLYIRPDGSETTTYPFQQWRYRYIQGMGINVIMEFVDIARSGDFRMTTDPHEKEGAPVARPERNGQLLRPPAIRFTDLKAAVDSGVRYNILPMQVHADYLPVSESSVRTDVTIRIENKDLQFQREEGKQKAVLNLYGRITSMSRRPVNVFEDNITVESPEALFSDIVKKSYLWKKSIALAPGEYRLNVAVRDVASGKMNSYELALNVPKP
jgi:GWxTD domain-containing protein